VTPTSDSRDRLERDTYAVPALPTITRAETAGLVEWVETSALLQDMVLDSADVEDFLAKLAALAAERLSESGREVLCGITLLRPRKHSTVATSSDVARHLDELQYAFGDGPCLTATRTEASVHVPDTRTDHRWTEYFAAISGHGIRSILAVPIPLHGEAGCGLNLYARTPNAFDQQRTDLAQHLAAQASQSLQLAVRIAHLTDTGTHLTTAMESRTTIDLAAGAIMAQNRCSQERAMTILKAASSTRNMKLRDVATAVVQSMSTEQTGTHFDS
jgi:GAF domain-containing protein